MIDMSQPSEGIPLNSLGVPSGADWLRGGRIGIGNEAGNFHAVTPWSVIYPLPENSQRNASVDVRNMSLFILSKKTGRWREVFSPGKIGGAYYTKKMTSNAQFGTLPTVYREPTTRMTVDERFMMHFWPASGRKPIEPDDVAGIFVRAEARMDRTDFDRGARYAMDVAADYWIAVKAKRDGLKNNRDAGIGRLKILTPEWRKFYMTTVGADDLARCIAEKKR
ncbi:hypothetical protein P8R33_01285 [Qipengyuania sp. XHP0211]|uniref:hypothetical protein n=1 Tax=Qipengyuania sp. XHP0211 TaxID=3038079 RepID=UPI00241C3D6D|nr:hypothetical protein [Qipengyuania sp. XHP0211]MDG5749731.1 hypothetical protein [Qipengyuania sp. XHP0211]